MPESINRILKMILMILLPLVVILSPLRLLASEPYLAFEYGRADFLPDSYGLTRPQRLELASANIRYVRANLPTEALSSQTLNGRPAYTEREVMHMADVQATYQSVWRAWLGALLLTLVTGYGVWHAGGRAGLATVLLRGGLLTLGILAFIALFALFAWQAWFEVFHQFFFTPGSWLFLYSDTLIRLFPPKFWTDATFTLAGFGLVGGVALVLAGLGLRTRV